MCVCVCVCETACLSVKACVMKCVRARGKKCVCVDVKQEEDADFLHFFQFICKTDPCLSKPSRTWSVIKYLLKINNEINKEGKKCFFPPKYCNLLFSN
jgi:hypothetical protein